MKALFLDIDGVLAPSDYGAAIGVQSKIDDTVKTRDKYGALFDPRTVAWLVWIIAETGAGIVISSSWRKDGELTMSELWKDRNLPGRIIGITSTDQKYEDFRGLEIQAWLNENPKVTSYAILDDEVDILPEHVPNFVRCDSVGITMSRARKVINILNRFDTR